MKKLISILLVVCIFTAFLIGNSSPARHNADERSQGTIVLSASATTQNSDIEMYDPSAGIDYSSEKKYIIKDGAASYQVVIPVAATEAEVHAANELVKYVQQSTGVSMNIITDDQAILADNSKYISIGATCVF